ncbi:MAG: class I SAM-dependent methyltransferase [Myxococcus sp.]|nr:class I SAM-dependent methyltransferase [Myxococcus sp.]
MASLASLLPAAIDARAGLIDAEHHSACRLFNGFVEGLPALAVDLYGTTLVIYDHSDSKTGDEALAREALAIAREKLPFISSALWKVRSAENTETRNGVMLLGDEKQLCRRVKEDGVWYALALRLNRDASLYLDTRALRAWAKATLGGKRVLNTFAYTASLGVAAKAGGASEVLNTDLNNAFLTVGRDSWSMNKWPVKRPEFREGDFFDVVGQLKRDRRLFDCVFVDPPLFSVTDQGRVDLVADMERLLNKVRPLIAHEGYLVAVNNAVFVPGADFQAALDRLCADGFMTLDQRISAPMDFLGTEATRVGKPPADPAPFTHSTKMAVLRVTRKDGKR